MSEMGCSFPGCDRHPSKGDTILRISKKGPGQRFVGRCEEHYGSDDAAMLAASAEMAARDALRSVRVKVDGVSVIGTIQRREEPPADGGDASYRCVCSSHRGTCTKSTCDHPEMWF